MKIKKIFDLSVTLSPYMPVWPTNPLVDIKPTGILSRDGYNVEFVSFATHTGTHVDAPYHFDERGATVDKLDLNVLISPGYSISPKVSQGEIGERSLREIWRPEYDNKAILLRTGWDKKRAYTKEFLYEFPGLSMDGAEFLISRGVKLIGIDTLGIEPYSHSDFSVHKRLLKQGVVVVEDLANLDQLQEGKEYLVVALPIKILNASGSMARVVALELE
ncbi:cyclase family protein [Metallosphaera tengchongensis]|uniref:Cyclase family protein n=1 Tax=Metallosphaera tengchongensis TaxID=1532350 RepID=A0A6N0NVA7_9CREN|nr:cyclase family protein [Metallosphaera tengchongensis]QKQ99070.1 cyclase family protein [Metallosphaera tengchongensis]